MTYVDTAIHPFGRMVMCHMLADTTEELLAMADKIGVPRKWIQKPGTYHEHFDICKAKRTLAVRAGAREISANELGRLLINRRTQARAASLRQKLSSR